LRAALARSQFRHGETNRQCDLPLHGGQVPASLGVRMAQLGRVIAEAIVYHYED